MSDGNTALRVVPLAKRARPISGENGMPRGMSRPTAGRLFSGCPPINPDTGRPYKGVLLGAPRALNLAGAGATAVLQCGAQVLVTVGDPDGGLTATRTFLVGPQSVFLGLGSYENVVIVVLSNNLDAVNETPVSMTWTDSDTVAVNGAFLLSPATVSLAAVAESPVPDGAWEFSTDSAVTVTWRDYSAGGGIVMTTIEALAAAATVRVKGSTWQTNAAGVFRFWLLPL